MSFGVRGDVTVASVTREVTGGMVVLGAGGLRSCCRGDGYPVV